MGYSLLEPLGSSCDVSLCKVDVDTSIGGHGGKISRLVGLEGGLGVGTFEQMPLDRMDI